MNGSYSHRCVYHSAIVSHVGCVAAGWHKEFLKTGAENYRRTVRRCMSRSTGKHHMMSDYHSFITVCIMWLMINQLIVQDSN